MNLTDYTHTSMYRAFEAVKFEAKRFGVNVIGSESEYILKIAKRMGFKLKIHADEIVSLGGAELACKMGCISADHLMKASERGLKELAKNKIVANLLPGTSFNLNKGYENARKMIDLNVPVSCQSESLQFVMQLGCLHLNMTPNEALTAVTINAACAIDRQNDIGSIEVGKKADFAIFDVPNIEYLMYHFGINHIDRVYKDGKLVVSHKSVQYENNFKFTMSN